MDKSPPKSCPSPPSIISSDAINGGRAAKRVKTDDQSLLLSSTSSSSIQTNITEDNSKNTHQSTNADNVNSLSLPSVPSRYTPPNMTPAMKMESVRMKMLADRADNRAQLNNKRARGQHSPEADDIQVNIYFLFYL